MMAYELAAWHSARHWCRQSLARNPGADFVALAALIALRRRMRRVLQGFRHTYL